MPLRKTPVWLAMLAASTLACSVEPPPTARPNLVLVLIDTLRADHVGAYGYARNTTPTLDALAADGLRFERAISQSSWTLPSMMSLFTARHPPDLPPSGKDMRNVYALDESETTLAERLSAAGYHTISVATNPHNVDEIFGLMQGFASKDYEGSAPASWVVDRALQRLDAWARDVPDRPFFLYLHLMDVHAPYAPPPPYASLFAPEGEASDDRPDAAQRRQVEALYDSALRFVDAQIGRLLGRLASDGLRESTVVAVTSDHGEAFWDSVPLERTFGLHAQGQPEDFGVGHGHTVFRELIDVPLILSGPGIPVGVRPGPVRLLDLAPTLLGRLGLPADSLGGDGVDLLTSDPPGTALSSTSLRGRQRSLVTSRYQLVRIGGEGGDTLVFDTREPGWPVAQAPRRKGPLIDVLESTLDDVQRVRVRQTHLDDGMLDSLRALGYVE